MNDVMNVGNDEEFSIKELAEKIIQITGSTSKIKFLAALKEGDMSRRRPDISKMKAIINGPLVTLEEGIKKTIEKRMF
jgi:UDP-glucose 4-epimerase